MFPHGDNTDIYYMNVTQYVAQQIQYRLIAWNPDIHIVMHVI